MPSTETDVLAGTSTSVAVKAPCRAATTANLTLSGLQTVDGVVLVDGDRVLVKDQTTSAENGIYYARTSAWQRTQDWDGARDARNGTLIPVTSGTVNADTLRRAVGTDPIDIGTTSVTFALAYYDGLLRDDLASVASGKGASLVGVQDAAGRFTGTNLEAILSEVYTTTEMADFIRDNRIINGCMSIHQRTGVITPANTTSTYALDRLNAYKDTAGVFTVEQSTDVPSNRGFTNSAKFTVTTADASVAAGDLVVFGQPVEGQNISDFLLGSASARPFILSFWVKSSITGTFGVSFRNAAVNRSYPAVITVNAANTWEQKTVTLTGDLTGTWLTTNGIGLSINICLMAGSTYQGTLNTWQAGSPFTTSAQTNWMATNANTFFITGLDLKRGSILTPYKFKPIRERLADCQRYCWVQRSSASELFARFGSGYFTTATLVYAMSSHPVEMRASPTLSAATAGNFAMQAGGTLLTLTNLALDTAGTRHYSLAATVASGGTIGFGTHVTANNTANARITFDAEL